MWCLRCHTLPGYTATGSTSRNATRASTNLPNQGGIANALYAYAAWTPVAWLRCHWLQVQECHQGVHQPGRPVAILLHPLAVPIPGILQDNQWIRSGDKNQYICEQFSSTIRYDEYGKHEACKSIPGHLSCLPQHGSSLSLPLPGDPRRTETRPVRLACQRTARHGCEIERKKERSLKALVGFKR